MFRDFRLGPSLIQLHPTATEASVIDTSRGHFCSPDNWLSDTMKDKVEVNETTEVIEEIDVGDGADPPYQLDPGIISCLTQM